MRVVEHTTYTYIAEDGKEFTDKVECLEHDIFLIAKDSLKKEREYQSRATDMLKHIKQLEGKLKEASIEVIPYTLKS